MKQGNSLAIHNALVHAKSRLNISMKKGEHSPDKLIAYIFIKIMV
jgi:hypothetical protein